MVEKSAATSVDNRLYRDDRSCDWRISLHTSLEPAGCGGEHRETDGTTDWLGVRQRYVLQLLVSAGLDFRRTVLVAEAGAVRNTVHLARIRNSCLLVFHCLQRSRDLRIRCHPHWRDCGRCDIRCDHIAKAVDGQVTIVQFCQRESQLADWLTWLVIAPNGLKSDCSHAPLERSRFHRLTFRR